MNDNKPSLPILAALLVLSSMGNAYSPRLCGPTRDPRSANHTHKKKGKKKRR